MGTVADPRTVHLTPSFDQDDVNVSPFLAMRTHAGAVPTTLVCALVPPALARYCIDTPLPGVTTVIACCAFASSVSRTMTPALAHACVLVMLRTRAVSETADPDHRRYT